VLAVTDTSKTYESITEACVIVAPPVAAVRSPKSHA